ncbi:MAG: hypothetical protein GX345_08360 [Clostridiales bacterium]|nr:hypothetical protein [Clostridiales bacterium]
MKNTKRGLSLLLVFVLFFGTVAIGLSTGKLGIDLPEAEVLNNADGPGAITFYVPETIYLQPANGTMNRFQYYADCNTSGTLNTEYNKTSGVVYFNCPGASSVSISASGAAVTLGASNSNSATLSTTVTAGTLSTAISEGSVSTITWTASYVVNGITMTAKAYSVAYAPYLEPVASAIRTYNKDGVSDGIKAYLQAFTYATGIHSVSGGTHGVNRTSGKIMNPMMGTITAPNNDGVSGWFGGSGRGTNYHNLEGDGDDLLRIENSPTASLVVDRSRYSNINQIPNFRYGLVITDSDRMDNEGYWYVSDYTDGPYQGNATVNKNKSSEFNPYWGSSGQPTGVIHDGSNTANVGRGIGAKVGDQTGKRMFSKALTSGAGTQDLLIRGAVKMNNGGEWNGTVNHVNIKINKVDKSALRSNVRTYINKGLQSADYTGDFAAYEASIKLAAERLGNPTNTTTTNDIQTKFNALTRKTFSAKVEHKFNSNKATITEGPTTFNSGDNVTVGPNSYTGYSLGSASGATTSTSQTTFNIRRAAVDQTYNYNAYTYAIKYNGNGSTGGSTANSSHTYDVAKALNANGFSRTGYTFAGWNTAANGSGTGYSNQQSVTNLTSTNGATVNLYAQWNANTYTLTYDANGGSVSPGSKTVTYDSTYGTLPTPTRIGYSFKGWYTASTGGTQVTSSTTVKTASNHKIYAQWTINQYTISFNSDGGSAVSSITQNYGTTVTPPSNPTKTGYSFSGWNPTVPTTMPAQNTNCKAQWTPISYTVAYNGNGATGGSTASSSHTYGVAKALTSNGFNKTGYNFAGWNSKADGSGTNYTNGQSVSNLTTTNNATVTLYAQWTVNEYTISFNSNGGSAVAPIKQNYGTTVTPPANPTRTGYTFEGWSPAVPTSMPAQNMTCTAQWKIKTYAITFDANGGTGGGTQTVNHGVIPTPPTVSRTGYTFDGWDKTIVAATEATTYTAKWKIKTYTITFDANGGTGGETQTVNHGVTPTPPTVSRTGYTFDGWDKTIVAATEATTYTAKWKIKTYAIAFDANGGTGGETQTVNHGVTPTPPTVSRTGYTFDGWDKTIVAATEATTYTAKWKIKTYTITFDANGGTGGETQTVNHGVIPTPPTVSRTGYTFDGWDKTLVAATEATTYKAKWKINTYTITFKLENGDDDLEVPTDHGEVPLAPTGFSKTGYTFDGWDKTLIAATEATTYTAQWKINTYTITFDADGGTGGGSQSVDHGDMPTPPTVSKEGYSFDGWDKTVVAATEDATYTAQWTVNSYYVTFDSNAGSGSMNDQEITFGQSANLTENAFTAPEGHNFAGWNTKADGTGTSYGDKASYGPMGAADVTLYAQWTVKEFTISFDSDGGSEVDSISQDYGTAVTAPTDPTKTGYTFKGWEPAIPSTMPAENLNCVAQWEVKQYSLTFKVDGETYATITQDYGTTVTAPADPEKEGYDFLGWSSEVPSTMPAENKVFNAQWSVNEYTLTFKVDGETYATITQDYGTEITPPADPTKTGYTFQGWSPELPETMPAQNVECVAQWKINTYTITFKLENGEDDVVVPTDHGEMPEVPTGFTKTGYTFDGWDETVVAATGDATYTAQWKINTYTITFKLENGEDDVEVPTDHGEMPEVPTGFTKTGYTFDGWDETVVAATEDATYTAQWKINTYTITFKLENGEDDVVVPTDHGEMPEVPTGFTKTGYTFDGWDETVVAATGDATYTAQWTVSSVSITFDANGGTGGWGPTTMTPGAPLTPPVVSREGYGFAGWNPQPGETVPNTDKTYVAQWVKTGVVVKVEEGKFVLDVYGWSANEQYQIWTYQKIVSDDLLNLDEDVPANQWLLSMAYTPASSGDPQTDGSIRFELMNFEDFTSPTPNYLVALRVADSSGNFLREIRDAYTPEDVGEPVITKVVVDGEVTTGYELREIKGQTTVIEVIGNNVEGMTYSAQVTAGQSATTIDADSEASNKFNWNLSEDLEPGIYIVEVKAEVGGVEKTYEIRFDLYKTEDQTEYGYIDNLNFEYDNGSLDFDMLFGTANDRNDYGNGSFSYRVREPGRSAFYRSVEFTGDDNITSYGINQPGIYEVSGYVTRVGYIGTEANGAYDDGIIRNFTIPRPGVNPKDIKLTLTADKDLPDIPKGTAVTFTAMSEGLDGVQYSFWRYDASGYILLKDWSTSNELKWTPARVGSYNLQVRAKGEGAGSYEIAKSIGVNVIDTKDTKANITNITLNAAELQANVKSRTPIMVKANATATNGDDLLYKFYVYDKDLRTRQLKGYSVDQHCVWKPRKPGVYTISVLVKNQVSFGKYDAIESFEIEVK